MPMLLLVIPAKAGIQRLVLALPSFVPMEKQPAIYILASERNGTLYIGVTSDLVGRTWQHREHVVDGFTKKYGMTEVVWYELHGTMESAITREKQIYKWNREWKIRLIEDANPYWNDLWLEITGQAKA